MELVFRNLGPTDPLSTFGQSGFRTRWNSLLVALGVPLHKAPAGFNLTLLAFEAQKLRISISPPKTSLVSSGAAVGAKRLAPSDIFWLLVPPLSLPPSPTPRGLGSSTSPVPATSLSLLFSHMALLCGLCVLQPPANLLSLRKGFEHGYGCYAPQGVQEPPSNDAS